MEQRTKERLERLEIIVETMDPRRRKRLDTDTLGRIFLRLDELSPQCDECADYPAAPEEILSLLESSGEEGDRQVRRKIRELTDHLVKKHNLVRAGTYLAVYMSMGISFGLIFGMLLFENNMALGIPIGMSIGIAVGSALDADARKKNKTI